MAHVYDVGLTGTFVKSNPLVRAAVRGGTTTAGGIVVDATASTGSNPFDNSDLTFAFTVVPRDVVVTAPLPGNSSATATLTNVAVNERLLVNVTSQDTYGGSVVVYVREDPASVTAAGDRRASSGLFALRTKYQLSRCLFHNYRSAMQALTATFSVTVDMNETWHLAVPWDSANFSAVVPFSVTAVNFAATLDEHRSRVVGCARNVSSSWPVNASFIPLSLDGTAWTTRYGSDLFNVVSTDHDDDNDDDNADDNDEE